MARCAAFFEVSSSDYADDRTVWNDIKAILANGQTICQYNGRSCDDSRLGGSDICDSQARAGDKRIDDRYYIIVRCVYGLFGTAGGIYTGLRLYDAFFSFYRTFPTGTPLK